MAQVQRRTRRTKGKAQWYFSLTKLNFRWILLSLAVILIGYILMATAITDDPAEIPEVWNNPLAVTVAPILLVIGYCITMVYALFVRKKTETQ